MAEMIGRRRGRMTDEQRRRMHETQKWVDENREELDRDALRHKQERLAVIEVFKLLKAQREATGLSVADIAQRSGIDEADLSNLENDPSPNPTLSTLMRYAEALGGRLELSFHSAA